MIKALIIDDELHCIETLRWDLENHCPEIEVVGQCQSAKEGKKLIEKLKPELVFLDIEMPVMNGFEMLESMPKIDFDFIITTAYDKFAIKAFKVSAIDYLLKPVDKDELKQAITKVSQKKSPITEEQMKLLFSHLNSATKTFPKLALPTVEGLEFVDTKTILKCQADSNYSRLQLKEGKEIMVSRTLKEIEEMLQGQNFFRVHQSHLVNLDEIKKYVRGDGGYVIMSNGAEVTVARSKKEELLKQF